MIAQRRPSYYLGAGQGQLAVLTDSYLRLLAEVGVIDAPLRDAALQAKLAVREAYAAGAAGTEVSDLKAATLARIQVPGLPGARVLQTRTAIPLARAGAIVLGCRTLAPKWASSIASSKLSSGSHTAPST